MNDKPSCITWGDVLARQDARDTRKWVTSSHEARLDMEGPPPSQRALDSLSSVRTNLLLDFIFSILIFFKFIQFAENSRDCRHVVRFRREEVRSTNLLLTMLFL